jgi:hypothetical protein
VNGNAQNRATREAAQTAQNTATQNNALAAYIYGQNRDMLNPYVQRGNAAGNQINALLGLGGGMAGGSTPAPTQPGQPAQSGGVPVSGAVNSMLGGGYVNQMDIRRDPMAYFGQDMISDGGSPYGLVGNPEVPAVAGVGTTGAPATTPQTAQQAANDAFNIFRNSTGYQFRVNEGQNALNSGYAGSGLLQSGAALRALDDYRQNMASNEFGNYMAYLGNQQGVGLSGASAVAGVGQNYANSVMQNNNSAGTAAANAALARGNNNPFGNALGLIGGGLFGMR